jgi:CHAT domain-containing protein/tetratricopeptide (TPR) repeat protein
VSAGLWLLAGAALANGPSASDEPRLATNEGVERRLGPGESHGYRIACRAGSYVHVVVEQHGVDVLAVVYGPTGAELLQVDTPTGPTGREGNETVSFVARRAGLHRLVLQNPDRRFQGTYVLRLMEQRAATARDRLYAEAWQLWAQGDRTRRQPGPEAQRQALDAYERSGRALQELAEDVDASRVLLIAGNLAVDIGERQEAVADYESVLALGSRAKAPHVQGMGHLGLGKMWRMLGEPGRARDHLKEALEIFRSLQETVNMATALTGLAVAEHDDFGNPTEALRLQEEVLALSRSAGDPRLERAALQNMAQVYDLRGDKTRALDCYGQALQLARAAGDRVAAANTLNDMGMLYTSWGDFARAGELHAEALVLDRAAGNRRDEASTLIHVGRTHYLQGDMDQAFANLSSALKLTREIKNATLEAAALSRLGEAYSLRGETTLALSHLRAAVAIYRGLDVKYWPALTLLHLGQACLRAGEVDAAQAALTEARQEAGRYDAPGIDAAAQRELARVDLARGEPEAALRHAESAVATVESERASIFRQDFRTTYFASVHPYYQTHIEALMALHNRDPASGHAAAALRVSERARARRMLEAVAESSIDVRSAADPVLARREQELRRELTAAANEITRLAEANATAGRRDAAHKKLRDLADQRQDVMARLRQQSPRYAALRDPPVLESAEIQKEIEPGTALLEYALGDERSRVWIVTSASLVSRELPSGARIDAVVRRLYESLSVRANQAPSGAGTPPRMTGADAEAKAAEAAAELSGMILPAELTALDVKRLVIVADGALQTVPFAALPLPVTAGVAIDRRKAPGATPLLGSRFELVHAPSASWVAMLRRLRERAAPAPKALAVFADPVFDRLDSRVDARPGAQVGRDGAPDASHDARLRQAVEDVGLRGSDGSLGLPRLLFTRQEALRTAALLPRRDVLLALDFEASRERALRPDLADYRIVQFATHSLLDNEHPELSGIVLSRVDQRGAPRDGFLRVQDIYDLRLPAELVILSACQTAVGKAVPGEGLIGLARAFMYAGARRVVASLWPVDEAATAELMATFTRELLQKQRAPAEALRRAQRAVAAQPRWRAPFYWAGFVVQGDWR